jgi:hypothetical protein
MLEQKLTNDLLPIFCSSAAMLPMLGARHPYPTFVYFLQSFLNWNELVNVAGLISFK